MQVIAGLVFVSAGVFGLGQTVLLIRYRAEIVGAIRWWHASGTFC